MARHAADAGILYGAARRPPIFSVPLQQRCTMRAAWIRRTSFQEGGS